MSIDPDSRNTLMSNNCHPLFRIGVLVALAGCVAACSATRSTAADNPSASPNTFYWDGAHLASMRAGKLNDSRYDEIRKRLSKNARIARHRGPYSVLDKDETAASGDKHDYLSYARYWWPNPNSPDGLPYIRRDGETNHQVLARGDRGRIALLYDDVETLALAGYLFDDQSSAEHGAMLVRTWFLDPATKMNPHLRYGQAVPGHSEGRGTGIIDTRHFIRILDSVALLKETGAWTEADHAGLSAWMRQYLDWLVQDPMGREEGNRTNNHGTWYDAQTAAIAMFLGERELARQIVQDAKSKRIDHAIEPDGQQPEELRRTKGLHYCVFNLSPMAILARIGEHLDVDLWNYESADGRCLRRGLDFVLPYLAGEKRWPHEQIHEMYVSPTDMGLFYLASDRYDKPRYRQVLEKTDRKPAKFEYAGLQFPGE
jgi:Alginate lyase